MQYVIHEDSGWYVKEISDNPTITLYLSDALLFDTIGTAAQFQSKIALLDNWQIKEVNEKDVFKARLANV